MRKLKLFSLLLITLTFIISCASEETTTLDGQNAKLLKEFKIKRDASGAYSLDFTLNQGTLVDKRIDLENNSNQFLLFPTENARKDKFVENMEINNDQLKVGFIDTNTDAKPSVKITDDNIEYLSRGNSNLKSYEVISGGENMYTLDFEVKNKITVDFVYNAEDNFYEIHLEDGDSKQKSYSRTFEKEEGKALQIVFVNHNGNAKEALIRKPIIIIDEGEDD
jgi:hypothetical protein